MDQTLPAWAFELYALRAGVLHEITNHALDRCLSPLRLCTLINRTEWRY